MGNLLAQLLAFSLPATLLSYGVVWWLMRPKQPQSFSFENHAICFCAAWAAATLANVVLAHDVKSVFTGNYSSPAMLLVPAIVAAVLIAWTNGKKRKEDQNESSSN